MQWIFIFNPCAQFWSWESCSVINVWCTLTQFCPVLSLRSVLFSFITGHILVHGHANWNITGNSCLCCGACFATLTAAHNFFFILMLREPKKLVWNAGPYFWECETSTYSKLCLKGQCSEDLIYLARRKFAGMKVLLRRTVGSVYQPKMCYTFAVL